MSHKLVLIVTSRGVLSPASSKLMYRIKTEDLLCSIPWKSREQACWAFRFPFLSILSESNSSIQIIQNQDDIIHYLKDLPPKTCTIDPTKRLFF